MDERSVPAGAEPVFGVLLANVGSPEAPTPAAVRRFLREFLSDRRVVDLPRALWWPILHGFILPFRPRRSARLYAKVWTASGSPLLHIARKQAEALRAALGAPVACGMRCGRPSIRQAMESLRDACCSRILVLPLFPQYSSATSASIVDGVFETLRGWRAMPEIRTIRDYHAEPAYVRAVAASIREVWSAQGEPDRLVLSFHGLPKRFLAEGDPYETQCRRSADLIASALGIDPQRWSIAFQSRFGREEWIRPYTDQTLRDLAASGVASVDVVAPGFATDCLETLEEMALRGRDTFLAAGGRQFRYLPALNDRPDHIEAIRTIIARHTAGWA